MRPPRTRALGDSRSGGPPRPTPAMADGRSEHRLSGDGAVFMDSAPGDADLVRDCLGGDRGAFDVLVQRYQKTVFNAAFRLVNSLRTPRTSHKGSSSRSTRICGATTRSTSSTAGSTASP